MDGMKGLRNARYLFHLFEVSFRCINFESVIIGRGKTLALVMLLYTVERPCSPVGIYQSDGVLYKCPDR